MLGYILYYSMVRKHGQSIYSSAFEMCLARLVVLNLILSRLILDIKKNLGPTYLVANVVG